MFCSLQEKSGLLLLQLLAWCGSACMIVLVEANLGGWPLTVLSPVAALHSMPVTGYASGCGYHL
jgi:hypothetical protein